MNTQQARGLGKQLAEVVARGDTDAAYGELLPVLQSRTPFRLLDLVGRAIGAGGLEPAGAFAQRVAAGRTEGGWVAIASILREQVPRDMPGALERARGFICEADVWYATDIIGERVPGQALVADFEQALALLAPWRGDPNRWVRRTAGVAAHLWAKRAHGDPALRPRAERLLVFFEPMFEERDVEAAKGVGWGLKTIGLYYPDTLAEWLARQAGRRPSALLLRKSLTYLSAEQAARVLRAFPR